MTKVARAQAIEAQNVGADLEAQIAENIAREKREMAAFDANATRIRTVEVRKLYGEAAASQIGAQVAITYDDAIRGEADMTLTQALGVIAGHFYDPGLRYNRDSGQHETVNLLAYTQRDVLNGFCWTLHQRSSKIEAQLDEARAKVKREVELSDGTELSLVAIDRAISWVERVEEQHMAVMELIAAAEAAHEIATGAKFVKPKIAPKAEAPRNDAAGVAAQARAAKLAAMGITSPVAPELRTDGVRDSDHSAAL